MDVLKKFIDLYVPITACNLSCPYCYISQLELWERKTPDFKYTAEHIKKALSKDRLGGVCHFNICGGGETLIPPEIIEIVKVLLENGHYIMIVTNGTISKRFDELIQFPPALLNRLGFKFSFHYLELIRTNKLEIFCENVNKVKKAGCSISIELTPYDELEAQIPAIQEFCLKKFGAQCHVTVARDESKTDIPILSNKSMNQYRDVWSVFDSKMFDFKLSTFYVKRNEFCYAGAWGGLLNLGTGIFSPCYREGKYSQNIFDDLEKPIMWIPVGKRCKLPHCFNSHSFLTLGFIPSLKTPTYADMRNRICNDGTEWLTLDMDKFLSQKLSTVNPEWSDKEKRMLPIYKTKLMVNNLYRQLKERKIER